MALGLLPGLFACHAPTWAPQLGPRPVQHFARMASAQEAPNYFPMEAGRYWRFELQQRQNGSDNTRYKTLDMQIEPLASEKGARRAVLRRGFPDSNVTPTPSLIQHFGDRVELSRYRPQDAATLFQFEPSAQRGHVLATENYIVALRFPLKLGESWEGRSFKGGHETIQIKAFETLELPAGRFDTVMIEHHLQYNNGKEDFLRYWYAPQVGMVKMHEELTVYFGQWLKMVSTGVLTDYGTANTP